MNHDQIRHLRNLRLLLSQDKAPLGFFLAAGCPLAVKATASRYGGVNQDYQRWP